ncbi:GspE/PulE family protein [Conexibacter sp. DBS9H8]|uniref:GspE/PulE family protein n=1 Tax=Conexibacter sp. DBS9H8 TaxID=2937801 RepID=UPI00200D84EB|nr:ATPase, T2SS/T4P/T4SS family [Conexibacter sp. DBS9H8]
MSALGRSHSDPGTASAPGTGPDPPPTTGSAAVTPLPVPGLTRARSGGPRRSVIEALITLGLITPEFAERARAAAREQGVTVERLLLEDRTLTAEQIARAVADAHRLDHIDLATFAVDMAAANLVPAVAARRWGAVPVAFVDEGTLLVAISDPANLLAIDDIRLTTGLRIHRAVASSEDIEALVSRLNRYEFDVAEAVEEDEETASLEITGLRESADDAPIIKLVHSILADAAERGASDVHFEPQPTRTGTPGEMRVRLRVDGVMVETATVPRRMAAGVISRVKIMADLDIAERRLPQDGRVGLSVDGRHIDLRVVTIPSVHGESAVIRILDQRAIRLDLDQLGLQHHELTHFRRAFQKAHGAILVTGPTGSGKSTTLYGALRELNTAEKNIITIEDPVEYQLPGITQMQVNVRAGLTFDSGLRSMMRADPDILMVGEIRDRQTAQIAVEGALTGHLVLSTLHTNDAPSAISRLVEMGIEPFLIASAIECVVGQRLTRTLCAHCKEPVVVPAAVLADNGFSVRFDIEAHQPVGCVRCGGMGYRGRTGIYEVMMMTEELRELTLARASADQIAAIAVSQGMRRMREDGLEKVKAGITSLAEVTRVTGSI